MRQFHHMLCNAPEEGVECQCPIIGGPDPLRDARAERGATLGALVAAGKPAPQFPDAEAVRAGAAAVGDVG